MAKSKFFVGESSFLVEKTRSTITKSLLQQGFHALGDVFGSAFGSGQMNREQWRKMIFQREGHRSGIFVYSVCGFLGWFYVCRLFAFTYFHPTVLFFLFFFFFFAFPLLSFSGFPLFCTRSQSHKATRKIDNRSDRNQHITNTKPSLRKSNCPGKRPQTVWWWGVKGYCTIIVMMMMMMVMMMMMMMMRGR